MKNFKLLLATTAILSTGLAMNVYSAADSVNAELQASIGIISPFSFEGGSIDFGDITTVGRTANNKIHITVKPDGTVDSSTNAQVVRNPVVTPMYLGGGDLGGDISTVRADAEAIIAEGIGGEHGFTQDAIDYATLTLGALNGTYSGLDFAYWSLVLSDPTFNLEAGENTCGEVSGLIPTWKLIGTEGKEVELRFGGTFTLDSAYTPEDGYGLCTGSTTVTYIRNNL